MTWVLLDDGFDEDARQLALSDRAVRLWVCMLAFCYRNRTNRLTPLQLTAMLRKLGKNRKTFEELLQKLICKVDESGEILVDGIHTKFPGSSTERVRKWRARQVQKAQDVTFRNASRNASRDVTPPPDETRYVTSPRARDPIPVTKSLLASLGENPPPFGVSLASLAKHQTAPPLGGDGYISVIESPFARDYDAFLAVLNEAVGRRFRGDGTSRKLYAKQRHDGRSTEDLLAAARGVAKSAHHMGLNDNGTPYNSPSSVLRSRVLDQLISLGNGEIGLVRRPSKDEQREAELDDWAQRKSAEINE